MVAGEVISTDSLSGSFAEKTLPLKVTIWSDSKCTPYSEESREESVCVRALFRAEITFSTALSRTWPSLIEEKGGRTTRRIRTIIAITTRISTKAIPLWPLISTSLFYIIQNRMQRRDHRDCEKPDPGADHDHQDRLDDSGKIFGLVLNFFFVEIGDLRKHIRQFTRFFADFRHLRHHYRVKIRVGFKGLGKGGSFLDREFRLPQNRLVINILNNVFGNLDGPADGNARGKERGNGAGGPGSIQLFGQLADNRQMQDKKVNVLSHKFCSEKSHQRNYAEDDKQKSQNQVIREKIPERNQKAGRSRELHSKFLEGAGQSRNDKGKHQNSDQDHGGENYSGIDEGAVDFLGKSVGLIQAQAHVGERAGEIPGLLAGAHHRDEKF